MAFHDGFDNRQAEPAARGVVRPRRIDFVEAIEHIRQVLNRNSWSRIADRQHHVPVVKFCTECDAPFCRRVPHGIGGKILQRLLEAERVANNTFRTRSN